MSETNTTETSDESREHSKASSDARIILGPLVKYALMGLVLVSVIVTTAIMLDRQLNDIEREVAELEAELAAANHDNAADTETNVEAEATDEAAVEIEPQTAVSTDVPVTAAIVEAVENDAGAQPSLESTLREAVVAAQAPAESIPDNASESIQAKAIETGGTDDTVATSNNRDRDPNLQSIESALAEYNAYLKQRDLDYLEALKATQEKQLRHMRDRLARQEQRIREMEARFQQRYEIRASSVQEMQDWREGFLTDRI